MKHLSLKSKALLTISAALLVVITLLTWRNYSEQKSMLLTETTNQVHRVGQLQTEVISNWLLTKQNAIEAVAKSVESSPLSTLQQAQQSGGFDLTYYGKSIGTTISSNPSIDLSAYDPRTRPWYSLAQSNGTITTQPYLDVASNNMSVTVAAPAANGVVGGDLSINAIVEQVSAMSLPANGYALLTHNDGTIIAYKDTHVLTKHSSLIDNDLTPSFFASIERLDSLETIYFESENNEKYAWSRPVANSDWRLTLLIDKSTLEAETNELLQSQLIIAASILLVSLGLLSWLIGMMLAPLSKVSQALAQIASGNGDLTQRIQVEQQDEVGALANNFNDFVDSQHQLITHIKQLSVELDSDAEKSLSINEHAVSELQSQQQEVAMVATAVTEMACATQEIATNAESTATAAQQSAESSQTGKAMVSKTRDSINDLANEVGQATVVIEDLNQHVQSISGILTAIQGIAEQTNLLALNAAIEAARAGAQGRGFAVVADEVRVLSHRTQESTLEIQSTIETLQKTTVGAVSLMESSQQLAKNSVVDADSAVASIEEITTAVTVISDMASQIATAAEEQAHVTDEITKNTNEIKSVSDEITFAAEQGLANAQDLKVKANDLSKQVGQFTL
ncbi:methyl-accepting chemotaxis protein [Vibrio sp. T187]|uniref:methyl-accepting chemotaxis protein n=1 Tax=Vibrio TaxID=662 RepID=UPI0010C9FF7C|nr:MULTISPECIES: methyl-accepting chemotaxis protein [Vibrio]MBW3698328.1 methyl-accepting chemotaxis protein [Vibrio sp. T187]